ELSFAFTDKNASEMRERGKIAARAETSLFRNDGMHAAVEAFENELERLDANAGKSACKRVRPDEHDRPRRRNIERVADTDRVADDDVSLQGLDLLAADDLVLERAESRRYPVGDLAAVKQRLHRVRRTLN